MKDYGFFLIGIDESKLSKLILVFHISGGILICFRKDITPGMVLPLKLLT